MVRKGIIYYFELLLLLLLVRGNPQVLVPGEFIVIVMPCIFIFFVQGMIPYECMSVYLLCFT